MSTKVRGYSDKDLLDHVSEMKDFNGFPKGRWLLAVTSNEDTPNIADDKIYVFENRTFIDVMKCTNNPGLTALKDVNQNKRRGGAAVIKSNQWCYDAFYSGYHRGKMLALRQRLKIWYHRDNNMNSKSEEIGKPIKDLFYTNIHSNTYKYWNKVIKWIIGPWSYGCIVIIERVKYMKHMKWFKSARSSGKQPYVTLCIIKEF